MKKRKADTVADCWLYEKGDKADNHKWLGKMIEKDEMGEFGKVGYWLTRIAVESNISAIIFCLLCQFFIQDDNFE